MTRPTVDATTKPTTSYPTQPVVLAMSHRYPHPSRNTQLTARRASRRCSTSLPGAHKTWATPTTGRLILEDTYKCEYQPLDVGRDLRSHTLARPRLHGRCDASPTRNQRQQRTSSIRSDKPCAGVPTDRGEELDVRQGGYGRSLADAPMLHCERCNSCSRIPLHDM